MHGCVKWVGMHIICIVDIPYTYSKHFSKRIEERDISIFEIEAIIYKVVPVLILPSKTDVEIDIYLGVVKKRGLMLAINKKTHVLVTARAMRENELKKYLEVI